MVRNRANVAVKRQGVNSTSQSVPKINKVRQSQLPPKTDEVENLKKELKKLEEDRCKMGQHLAKEDRRLKRETFRYERDADHHEEQLQITYFPFFPTTLYTHA
ncbi:hypothetical protein GCK72_025903 [Caenorhabditis remanei]|uniref:Uncharacterized protein n=1 Tax=Caenorhabditis remanei TaxID=31234 RepID=A0A6A5G3Z5_CAERE|nr:hypothetical protein GCK72_025903 [Caenorhabditis remanei]KAF1749435.1 hypothetical protein GCK72_025903 [Caenorhabditis remanei]